MSGKRILDALALFNVSRKIATKHFNIRFSQVQLYGQTSSLVKALRTQGPPVVAAAASRFASSPSSPNFPREGIEQDHFYESSERNSTADPPASKDLDVEQVEADRNPLPDGTIPPQESPIGQEPGDGITFNTRPVGETLQHPLERNPQADLSPKSSDQSTIPNPSSRSLSSEEARRLQRQSEDQIPSRTAEPPKADEGGYQEFGVEQEKDVFYQPPGNVKPVLSALPRVRVPKTENDVQEGDSHIPPGINADVYYSGVKDGEGELEPTEEELSQLFRNPKNSKLFSQKAAKHFPSGGVTSRSFHTSRLLWEKASSTDAESIKQLAADMTKDAERLNVSGYY